VVSDVLQLLHVLRDEIPLSSLLQLPVDDSRSNARGPLDLALNFYRLDIQLPCNHVRKALQLPFVTAFEDTVSFSAVCASAMSTSVGHRKIFRDLLVQSLSLLNELVIALALEREMTLIVDWNPSDWLYCLVAALETEVSVVLHSTSSLNIPLSIPKDTTFLVVDQVTTSLVSLQNVAGLQPAPSIDHPLVISKLLRTVR
jgi:hypothetical protein